VWSLGDTLVAALLASEHNFSNFGPHERREHSEGPNKRKHIHATSQSTHFQRNSLKGGLWRDEQGGLARGVCKAT
jgi:hypothetical protein